VRRASDRFVAAGRAWKFDSVSVSRRSGGCTATRIPEQWRLLGGDESVGPERGCCRAGDAGNTKPAKKVKEKKEQERGDDARSRLLP
jgi:hypothetical protein